MSDLVILYRRSSGGRIKIKSVSPHLVEDHLAIGTWHRLPDHGEIPEESPSVVVQIIGAMIFIPLFVFLFGPMLFDGAVYMFHQWSRILP